MALAVLPYSNGYYFMVDTYIEITEEMFQAKLQSLEADNQGQGILAGMGLFLPPKDHPIEILIKTLDVQRRLA